MEIFSNNKIMKATAVQFYNTSTHNLGDSSVFNKAPSKLSRPGGSAERHVIVDRRVNTYVNVK